MAEARALPDQIEDVAEELANRIVTDKVVGDTLEQRVVDKDGKTVEFYQLKEGHASILQIDPETPLKYAKLLKEHMTALKTIEALEARVTEFEDALSETAG